MTKLMSRRQLLERGVQVSMAALAAGMAAGTATAGDKVCADMKSMDSASRSMRGSLNYAEASTDPVETCSVCAFFQATADGCGSCQIFNGPVNSKGHCDSWGAKD